MRGWSKGTGKELDGADLCTKHCHRRNPLSIWTTSHGKRTQSHTGYMEIFAPSSMTGSRNPKAHENRDITKERAIHHLVLASLLFSRLDELDQLK